MGEQIAEGMSHFMAVGRARGEPAPQMGHIAIFMLGVAHYDRVVSSTAKADIPLGEVITVWILRYNAVSAN